MGNRDAGMMCLMFSGPPKLAIPEKRLVDGGFGNVLAIQRVGARIQRGIVQLKR